MAWLSPLMLRQAFKWAAEYASIGVVMTRHHLSCACDAMPTGGRKRRDAIEINGFARPVFWRRNNISVAPPMKSRNVSL